MKIYLTLLILFLSEFVNATTIIKNGKLMYHAWTNEEKKPYPPLIIEKKVSTSMFNQTHWGIIGRYALTIQIGHGLM